MRLMLTGANGQVGWELARSLKPLGEVVVFDRAGCDLSRPHELAGIVDAVKPDILINAAAYTAVDKAEEEEELATIVNGTAVGVLAEAARKSGALFVHYSTDYVFDGSKDAPYTEGDATCPINAYGRSKLAGEQATGAAAGDYLILRTSWVYAGRGRNFLRTMLRLGREKDRLRIVSDQIGAPTWAAEIADGTASILGQAWRERRERAFVSSIFNLTAAGATSWCGFARAIFDRALPEGLLDRKPLIEPIASADYPVPAQRPKNSRLSGARLGERFGVALADWSEALTRCMQDRQSLGQS